MPQMLEIFITGRDNFDGGVWQELSEYNLTVQVTWRTGD